MNTPTQQEIDATRKVVFAVAEAIRDLQRVPSGVLYAQLCGTFSLADYQSLIGLLKKLGLVREEAHELIWTGPANWKSF